MRVRRLLLALLANGSLAAAACSSFTSTDPLVAETDDAATDVGTVDPVEDAAADAPRVRSANLLVNAGFEDGCGGWTSSDSDPSTPTYAQSDTIVFDGKHACRVCSKSAGAFSIVQKVQYAGSMGAVVNGALQVHSNGDAGAGLASSTVAIVSFDTNGSAAEKGETPGPTVNGTWQRTSAILPAKSAFGGLALRFTGVAPSNGYCYVVDDAVLTVEEH